MPVGFGSLPFVRMRVVKSDDFVGSFRPFQVSVIVRVMRRPRMDAVWVVALMVSVVAVLRVVGVVVAFVKFVDPVVNCS